MESCWNCGAELVTSIRLCDACRSLQPVPPGLDHFAALELPRTFQLPLEVLEAAFKRISRQIHPDRFSTASDRERRYALEHATAVNDAWRTLRVPIKRAEYLLGLWGRPVNEVSGRTIPLPMSFLEQVMDLREQLSDAKAARDPDALARLSRTIHEAWMKHYAQVSAQFNQQEALLSDAAHAPLPADQLDALYIQVLELRYLHALLNEEGVSPLGESA